MSEKPPINQTYLRAAKAAMEDLRFQVTHYPQHLTLKDFDKELSNVQKNLHKAGASNSDMGLLLKSDLIQGTKTRIFKLNFARNYTESKLEEIENIANPKQADEAIMALKSEVDNSAKAPFGGMMFKLKRDVNKAFAGHFEKRIEDELANGNAADVQKLENYVNKFSSRAVSWRLDENGKETLNAAKATIKEDRINKFKDLSNADVLSKKDMKNLKKLGNQLKNNKLVGRLNSEERAELKEALATAKHTFKYGKDVTQQLTNAEPEATQNQPETQTASFTTNVADGLKGSAGLLDKIPVIGGIAGMVAYVTGGLVDVMSELVQGNVKTAAKKTAGTAAGATVTAAPFVEFVDYGLVTEGAISEGAQGKSFTESATGAVKGAWQAKSTAQHVDSAISGASSSSVTIKNGKLQGDNPTTGTTSFVQMHRPNGPQTLDPAAVKARQAAARDDNELGFAG